MSRILRMLAAILIGNALYFPIRASLPFPFAHEQYRVDPGLLLDFLLCLALYGISVWLWPPKRR